MFLFRRNFTRKSFSSLDRWNVLRSSYLFVGHFSTQLYLSNYENYLRNLDKLWKKSRWHSYTIYHFNFTSNVFSRYPELFFVLLRREQKIKKRKELRVDGGRVSNESSSWDRENSRGTGGSDSPGLCRVSSGFTPKIYANFSRRLSVGNF